MYKVYINERLLHFVSVGDSLENCELILRLYGDESSEQIDSIVKSFEVNIAVGELILLCENIDKSWVTFVSLYLLLEAAGGVVYNQEQSMLMIFRNGIWDLPKGKIERGEDPEMAAIREIFEECGISGLNLVKQLPTSYHTYPFNDQIVLKKTYWFLMTTKDISNPIPQLEEGITEVRWMDKVDMKLASRNTYLSITNLLKEKEMNESSGLLE